MAIPLSVSDIRCSGPDRDREDAFDPAATWEQARGFAEGGYDPAEVAALLNELDEPDRFALLRYIGTVRPDPDAEPLWFAWRHDLAKRVGDRFAAILLEWLGGPTMALVLAENTKRRHEGDMATCAAHDHCDANMALSQAFEDHLGRKPFDAPDGSERAATIDEQEWDCLLWNAAYEHAMRHHLTNPAADA